MKSFFLGSFGIFVLISLSSCAQKAPEDLPPPPPTCSSPDPEDDETVVFPTSPGCPN